MIEPNSATRTKIGTREPTVVHTAQNQLIQLINSHTPEQQVENIKTIIGIIHGGTIQGTKQMTHLCENKYHKH